jgi:hypothetical protein
MKLLCQLIHQKSGTRSEVLEMARDQMATELHRTRFLNRHDPDTLENINRDVIIVLMEKPDGVDEEYSFSQAPLMTTETFINYFLTQDAQDALFSDWQTIEDLQEATNHG